MHKHLLLLCTLLLNGYLLLPAQTTILDFESAETSTTFTYFGSSLEGSATMVVDNPNASGINTSANVSNFTKPAGAQTWAGAFTNPDPATPVDLTSDNQICVKVLFSQPGNVALKLEASTTGGGNWIRQQEVTTVNEWTEVCFDATLPSIEAPTTPAAGHVYARVVLFFDFGTSPTADRQYYFDDIIVRQGEAEEVPVTFSVDMAGYEGDFTQVYVSGTFNDWSGEANPLSDADMDGVWTATIPILTGTYEYKFTVDNWADQEQFTGGEDCTLTTGEFTNRVVIIAEETELDTVCWNSCYACGEEVTITINVGTSHIDVAESGLFIAGGGNFGNPGDFELTDEDGDGVYSITITRPRGFSSYYTFTNGNCPDYSCKENIAGQECANPGNFNDRFMGAITQDTVINTCFGICTDTTDCGDGPQTSMVTFSVDMSLYEDDFTQVYLSGSFNNWSGDANPLSDADGDGIWEGTLELVNGTYEYKFSLDNWANSDNLTGGDSCTITDPSGQFTNRVITVEGDAELPTVCFNYCASCDLISDVDELAELGIAFTVQPTLTSDLTRLAFGGQVLRAATVYVVDPTGRLLQRHRLVNQTDYMLDLSSRPAGLYFVVLEVDGARTARRVVKQ